MIKNFVDSELLCSLIKTKDINKIKIILSNNNNDDFIIKYKNPLRESLLHIATKYNFKEMVSLLLVYDLDIDSVDYASRTALHYAVERKYDDIVKYLLEHKANLNKQDRYGISPFHVAIELGRIEIVKLFLKYGAHVLDIDQTSLHIALKNEHMEILELLLKNYRGDFDMTDMYGDTLLHTLARQHKTDVTISFLKKGANLETINRFKETPLHIAIHSRNFNIAKVFIEFGANVNIKNKFGESPLNLAIRYKDLNLVNLLLMNSANINEEFLLHVAIDYYNKDIANLLLQLGVNTETRIPGYLSPFHLAIRNKNLEFAKILVSKGIDVNSGISGEFSYDYQKENNKNQPFTPLHTGIIQKEVNSVKFLLENGAKLDFENNYEIFLAIERGCAKVVEELIKYGANVNVKNETGQSLLFTAMRIRNKEKVQVLLKYGANLKSINETGYNNESALHVAVKANDNSFVQFLLDIGIDVNICDIVNRTALYYTNDRTNISKLLIANIAVLKASNLYVDKVNEIIIETMYDFKLFFSKCLEELFEIKKQSCCNISFINFLTKDVSILAKYVRQKAIIINFNKSIDEKKFPIYFRELMKNFEKGMERWNLIKQVKGILCSLTYFELLYDILDKIVDNFSNDELKNFIKNL